MSELDVSLENYEELAGDDVGLTEDDQKYISSNKLEWFKGEKNHVYRASLAYFHPLQATVLKRLRKAKPAATKEEKAAAIAEALKSRAEKLSKAAKDLSEAEMLDTSSVQFKRLEAHYKEGFGYVISRLGKDGAEADEVWRTLGDVKTYYTTVLILYPMANGKVVTNPQLVYENFKVMPWRISGKPYERFHSLAEGCRSNELNLATQDIVLKCTNADYQNWDIDLAGKALWRSNPSFQKAALSQAMALYP